MVDLKNYMVGDDENTINQINGIISSPAFKYSKVRIMPDAHSGKGCVVGTTATFTDMIVPNVVGVDIACRVSAFTLGHKDMFDETTLARFDKVIHDVIPSGFAVRNKEHELSKSFHYEELRCWDKLENHARLRRSMGTLGGGNHYIELDVDAATGQVWLIIHSGSRNLGKQVAEYYQKRAIELREERIADIKSRFEKLFERCRNENKIHCIEGYRLARNRQIAEEPSDDLCYLEDSDLDDYLNDMSLCNEWSERSHMVMYYEIRDAMNFPKPDLVSDLTPSITCIHNYVDVEHKIIRKGAIAGYRGHVGLIPLNMKDGILIVRAKGNEDWNCSLPHGAGRIMSRAKAKHELNIDDYKDVMDGIYSSCLNENTLDEAPMAYKNAEDIKAAIKPNAVIVGHLKPIYNFKAND